MYIEIVDRRLFKGRGLNPYMGSGIGKPKMLTIQDYNRFPIGKRYSPVVGMVGFRYFSCGIYNMI